MASKVQDPLSFYEARIAEGMSPRLAEMLALQAAPRCMTDREFLQGLDTFDSQLYAAEARAHGINPESHVYLSQLASYPGDPTAYVSSRGDVERVAREKGIGLHGAVNVKPREVEVEDWDAKEYRVADSIVERYVADAVAQNPEIAPTPRERMDLKEKVSKKLSGNAKTKNRNPLERD